MCLLIFGFFISPPTYAQTAESYRQEAIELSQKKSWDKPLSNTTSRWISHPTIPLTHYNLALTLKYKGDARPAIEEFESALRLKPNWSGRALWVRCDLLRPARAASCAKGTAHAVKLNAANVPAHRLLARIYVEQSDLLASEAEFRRALAIKPTAELHFELGLVEGQIGNLDAAAAQFRSAIRMNPAYAPAHSMLGITERRQGDHNSALAEFRKAAELDPKDPETQYNLGMELKAGDDLVGAIAALRQAIELKAGPGKSALQPQYRFAGTGSSRPPHKRNWRI